MAYDDARYQARHFFGPLHCTIGSPVFTYTTAGLAGAVVYQTATSTAVNDRRQFFKNIKLLGVSAILRHVDMAGARLIKDHKFTALVFDGTAIVGSCGLGTVARVGSAGGVSGTPTIDSSDKVSIQIRCVSDGTVGTSGAISADVFLEYQDRLG